MVCDLIILLGFLSCFIFGGQFCSLGVWMYSSRMKIISLGASGIMRYVSPCISEM